MKQIASRIGRGHSFQRSGKLGIFGVLGPTEVEKVFDNRSTEATAPVLLVKSKET